MITVLGSNPSSHHSPSPLPLTTPTHSSSHHSPLLFLITPLTPLHTTPPSPHYSSLLPLTTTPHYSPHFPSLPLTTLSHHTSSPCPLHQFTMPVLTYLPRHTSSPPSSPLPSSHSFGPWPHHFSSPLLLSPPLLPTTLKVVGRRRDIITPKDSLKVILQCL